VKQARHLVGDGALGEIRKVIVEYNQGWLASRLESTGHKQAQWRTDRSAPASAAPSRHRLPRRTTGQLRDRAGNRIPVCRLTTFVHGRRLDDDANLLIRYTNGARGLLYASQICVATRTICGCGCGAQAGIEWRQEEPNYLTFKPAGAPEQILRRGNDYLCRRPEPTPACPADIRGLYRAFANVYRAACQAIRAGDGCRGGRSVIFLSFRRGPRRALHRDDGGEQPQPRQVDRGAMAVRASPDFSPTIPAGEARVERESQHKDRSTMQTGRT